MKSNHDLSEANNLPGSVSARRTDRVLSTPIVRTLLMLLAVAATIGSTACTKKVPVPSLAQMDLDQAKVMLSMASLKPGHLLSSQGAVIPGAYVTDQSPKSGQQVPVNTPIDLTVALPIAVPNLVNTGLTEAVNTLQMMGLRVMLVKQPTANVFSKTKVIEQNPPASSMVRPDTAVMLKVTSPPDLKVLLGAVEKDPAYQKLNPEYRSILDTFLK